MGSQTVIQNGSQDDTQNRSQVRNILKTKNQKLKTRKENTPNGVQKKLTFGEFKNVLLTEAEYERLKADYGAELSGIIEHFSSYIEMKGYKAKSHNLAIRNWVVTAYREKKQRENALEKREKGGVNNGTKIEFKEYPEYDTYGTDDPEQLAEEIRRIKEKCAKEQSI